MLCAGLYSQLSGTVRFSLNKIIKMQNEQYTFEARDNRDAMEITSFVVAVDPDSA